MYFWPSSTIYSYFKLLHQLNNDNKSWVLDINELLENFPNQEHYNFDIIKFLLNLAKNQEIRIALKTTSENPILDEYIPYLEALRKQKFRDAQFMNSQVESSIINDTMLSEHIGRLDKSRFILELQNIEEIFTLLINTGIELHYEIEIGQGEKWGNITSKLQNYLDLYKNDNLLPNSGNPSEEDLASYDYNEQRTKYTEYLAAIIHPILFKEPQYHRLIIKPSRIDGYFKLWENIAISYIDNQIEILDLLPERIILDATAFVKEDPALNSFVFEKIIKKPISGNLADNKFIYLTSEKKFYTSKRKSENISEKKPFSKENLVNFINSKVVEWFYDEKIAYSATPTGDHCNIQLAPQFTQKKGDAGYEAIRDYSQQLQKKGIIKKLQYPFTPAEGQKSLVMQIKDFGYFGVKLDKNRVIEPEDDSFIEVESENLLEFLITDKREVFVNDLKNNCKYYIATPNTNSYAERLISAIEKTDTESEFTWSKEKGKHLDKQSMKKALSNWGLSNNLITAFFPKIHSDKFVFRRQVTTSNLENADLDITALVKDLQKYKNKKPRESKIT